MVILFLLVFLVVFIVSVNSFIGGGENNFMNDVKILIMYIIKWNILKLFN